MIGQLQFISQENNQQTHLQSIEAACKGGVQWVQLRIKDKSEKEILPIAQQAKTICDQYKAFLIVNDYPKIALAVNAYGVHVGKEDMTVQQARAIVGDQLIIGGTANTFEDVLQHYKDGADYVGLGPFRFTTTKKKLSPVLGLEGYVNILNKLSAKNISIPIIAIGGIEIADIPAILNTGVYGVAVSSLITLAADKTPVVNAICNQFKTHQTNNYVNNS